MADRSTYPQLTGTQHSSFAIRMQREQFEAQPPDRQAETLERVRLLLQDEQRRKQNQPSYLMQHAKEIYGI